MIIPFQYKYVSWEPPSLSETEELELGQRIALVGREQFVREFRQSIYKAHAKPKQDWIDRLSPGLRKAVLTLLAVLLLVGLLVCLPEVLAMALPVGVLIIFVLGIYLVSAHLSTRRFEKWIDQLVIKYAAHVANNTGKEKGDLLQARPRHKLSVQEISRPMDAALIANLGLPLLPKDHKYLEPEYQNLLPEPLRVRPLAKALALGQALPGIGVPTLAQVQAEHEQERQKYLETKAKGTIP